MPTADTGLMIEVARELFPEIDAQTLMPYEPGKLVARLTARIGFSKARARIDVATRSRRLFAGNAIVDGIMDNWEEGEVHAVVKARGSDIIGSFVVYRHETGIRIDVFGKPAGPGDAILPDRRVTPDPTMWLFPLVQSDD